MSYPRILISLPIFKREWILEHWLKCIENQTIPLENIGFQFLLGSYEEDAPTHEMLWEWQQAHPSCFLFDAQIDLGSSHATHEEGIRNWARDEYLRMVYFRNSLLTKAADRADTYDFYFSLDSDVLLENPKTLETLASHNVEVVSPFMHMMPMDECPNSMKWLYEPRQDNPLVAVAQRAPVGIGLTQTNVPMAAVMMKPEVVTTTRYTWHPQGEDIGFATQLHNSGIKSYVDFDIYTPHIMHRWQLNDYLVNGDRRFTQKVVA